MKAENPFALFDLPARPVLDGSQLQVRLHEFGMNAHPDQALGQEDRLELENRWKKINEAHRILSKDTLRLKCLLQLQGVEDPNASGQTPEKISGLFTEIGPLLHECNEYLKELESAESGLEKALLQSRGLELSMGLQGLASKVGKTLSELESRVQAIDATWSESPDVDGLLTCYREWVYVERWVRQIDECQFRLMSGA